MFEFGSTSTLLLLLSQYGSCTSNCIFMCRNFIIAFNILFFFKKQNLQFVLGDLLTSKVITDFLGRSLHRCLIGVKSLKIPHCHSWLILEAVLAHSLWYALFVNYKLFPVVDYVQMLMSFFSSLLCIIITSTFGSYLVFRWTDISKIIVW